MSIFTGTPSTGLGLPITANDENPQEALGQVIFGDDGRKYRYVKVGVTALTRGLVYQSPAEDTGDQDIAATATAVGATSVVTGSMTVTANQYAGGYMVVSVTPGLANMYRIKQHAAFTGAAATFVLEDAIQVALTSSSRLDFIANPANGVIVQAVSGSQTGTIQGVAVVAVTAGYYGWLQIAGPGPVTNDANAAITVGLGLGVSASVAGSVRLETAGLQHVGIAMSGIAASQVGVAFLQIG